MSRVPLTIARLLVVAAFGAVVLATSRVHAILGLGLFVAGGLGFAGYLLRDDLARLLDRILDVLGRPVGRVGRIALGLWIVTAPAILYFDPVPWSWNLLEQVPWSWKSGHIDRDPRSYYELVSDDVAYVAASRTWDRTVANLMVPHNTHIVPAWRVLTWAVVAMAGDLRGLPDVFAVVSYSVVIAVMIMTGRLVARETGRAGPGLAASALVGTTSLMLTPGLWYSGGQPLWAALGILGALRYAQCYRRDGRWPALILAALAASVAGGFWSAGHLAGPVTAVYLWFDGRRRCRIAAAVPLVATAVTVALFFALAARPMDSTVSFHGRTVGEAANLVQGLISTAQAVPQSLVFANLGLDAEPTPIQGVMLTLSLLALWASRRWRRSTGPPPGAMDGPSASHPVPGEAGAGRSRLVFACNPLESAGAAMVLGCYLLEWTFRGYLDYENLRTLNPYAIVPWYDLIPQVGAVLFAVGWWSGPYREGGTASRPSARRPAPPSRSTALVIAAMILVLIILNRPRVDALIRGTSPPLTASEQAGFKIPRLQTMRASTLLQMRVDWQRRYLRRLDQAEPIAQRLGIGQDGIRAAFGFLFIPGSTGRLLQSHREFYDVAAILNLPAHGPNRNVAAITKALGPHLLPEEEPRPKWLAPGEKWPADR